MKYDERVMSVVESGIAPFVLSFETVRFPRAKGMGKKAVILRSTLLINSLELGVLSPREYRYVARRNKKGDALTACHIEKLFEMFPRLVADEENMVCVSLPIYPKTLMSGAAMELLFDAFARYPDVSAERVCVEISADLLYEDITVVASRLQELRRLGIKIAIFELGDEFCPWFRLSRLSLDYAFLESAWEDLPEGDEQGSAAGGLLQMLHSLNIRAFMGATNDENLIQRALQAGFDGWAVSSEDLTAPAEEAPAEETPAEEAPAEETPAEEASAEETPAEEAPAEEAPAEEAPAEEPPAEEAPAEEAFTEQEASADEAAIQPSETEKGGVTDELTE